MAPNMRGKARDIYDIDWLLDRIQYRCEKMLEAAGKPGDNPLALAGIYMGINKTEINRIRELRG